MTNIESLDGDRTAWIARFTAYVLNLRPTASADLVEAAASERYARLAEFDPIDVAEAEWEIMDLGD